MEWREYQRVYGKGALDFEDQKAIDHAISNEMKRWPRWKMWVHRIEGCNHMSWICGQEFWYDWGFPYNQYDEESSLNDSDYSEDDNDRGSFLRKKRSQNKRKNIIVNKKFNEVWRCNN